MAELDVIQHFFSTRTAKLVETFASFIFVQLVFATLYLWLHRRRSDNFAFNSDILRTQSASIKEIAAKEIAKLTSSLEAIVELLSQLDGGSSPVVDRGTASVSLPSGKRCIMEHQHRYVPFPVSANLYWNQFKIVNSDGTLLLDIEPTGRTFKEQWKEDDKLLQTPDEWRHAVQRLSVRLDKQKRATESRQASLSTEAPDVWSYWDFLYFSTIVQTTVGFGDILPNSTPVRMVVTTQIVIGYALLIVVLTVVLGG